MQLSLVVDVQADIFVQLQGSLFQRPVVECPLVDFFLDGCKMSCVDPVDEASGDPEHQEEADGSSDQ